MGDIAPLRSDPLESRESTSLSITPKHSIANLTPFVRVQLKAVMGSESE